MDWYELCQHCTDTCCGIVPLSEETFYGNIDIVQAEIKDILTENGELYPITIDGKCVFYDREIRKCLIYSDRPQVCKDFATNHKGNIMLMCPYYRSNGKRRRPVDTKRLIREVKKIVKRRLDEK